MGSFNNYDIRIYYNINYISLAEHFGNAYALLQSLLLNIIRARKLYYLMKKYKISLNDYHEFRALLKSRLARLDNNWKTHFLIEINRILSLVTDDQYFEELEKEKEKWAKRINPEGEQLETYGHNISRQVGT